MHDREGLDRISNELPQPRGQLLALAQRIIVGLGSVPVGLLLIIFGVFSFLPVLDSGWCRSASCCLRKTSPSFDDRYYGRCFGWKENG